MRLVTFVGSSAEQRLGALIDDDAMVIDLQSANVAAHGNPRPELASVLALIEGGDAALQFARSLQKSAPEQARMARSQVKLRAPIQPPPQMRDCLCFELHLRQCFESARRFRARRSADPEAAIRAMDTSADDRVLETFNRQPIYYKANRFAVIGTDEDVIWPSFSKALDFELEFGCYIARKIKDVGRDAARSHIVGYTIFNDISARDAQALEMPGLLGPAKSKDFDTANVMGPCLVTADEIEDPYDLTMIARVNGEEWGRGNSRDMRWKFEDIIAHVSRSETLYPGEFLGSGTVGNGCGFEQMRYLKADDIVELEVEGIGVLRSRIVRPQASIATSE
ncbi:MAG TPA: fumarylacetoacetate hydrolase family protein [Steroidobacteraceae bacterium]|nr:fumarylacetoacetate hydrolase family protein [Steroidobacteraceae bacterium]